MTNIKVIVIGSSAGGVMALKQLVAGLPANFKIPIFIVQHVPATSDSYLADILDKTGPLTVKQPSDGDRIIEGTVYVAPPDHHMLIEGERILVKRGPKENRFRPSIDALFRSAAYTYGKGTVGIILTGMLDDGCSGMWSIKRMGGITIVQDPDQALYPSMPLSVLEYIDADHISPIAKIGPLLAELTSSTVDSNSATVHEKEVTLLQMEVDIAALGNAFKKGITEMGHHSALTCPECGGALNSFTEGKLIRYRCHTGHAYSSAALLTSVNETTEHKLWAALRSLEEAVMIVEKQAALTDDLQPAISHSIKIRTLKTQVDELRNFLSHYLQFNDFMGSK